MLSLYSKGRYKFSQNTQWIRALNASDFPRYYIKDLTIKGEIIMRSNLAYSALLEKQLPLLEKTENEGV